MNIYLLSQDQNKGYDTFESCVVVANNEQEAKTIHPRGIWNDTVDFISLDDNLDSSWATSSDKVSCQLIGKASKKFTKLFIVCASFNAG